MKPVELFHIGAQKCGTTWLFRCLQEHPEVACPPRHTIHYFDMHYHRGRDWYATHFADRRPGQLAIDPTPSTLRSPWAARRIHRENPDARLVVCLRNPMERAFSHYWHEKKKLRFEFEFEEVLTNYDLYSDWLEPGFYAEHLERFLEFFPRERILCQRFEQIADDSEAFFVEFCRFAGVADDVRPSVLNRKVNAARERETFLSSRVRPKLQAAMRKVQEVPGLKGLTDDEAFLSGKAEYDRGVPEALVEPLWAACEPEVRRLEALTGLNLADWRPATGDPVGT